jgi:hypothetical protein
MPCLRPGPRRARGNREVVQARRGPLSKSRTLTKNALCVADALHTSFGGPMIIGKWQPDCDPSRVQTSQDRTPAGATLSCSTRPVATYVA